MGNFPLDVAVLVSTKQSYSQLGVGKWMNISDYKDKTEFLRSAQKFCTNELGCHGDIYFVDANADFNIESLINNTSINEDLWGFIALNDIDDINLVQAYTSCFAPKQSVAETYKAANKALYGCFASQFSMVSDYRYDLSTRTPTNHEDIFKGLDASRLSDTDMAAYLMQHMIECNGYYFWKSSEDSAAA